MDQKEMWACTTEIRDLVREFIDDNNGDIVKISDPNIMLEWFSKKFGVSSMGRPVFHFWGLYLKEYIFDVLGEFDQDMNKAEEMYQEANLNLP